jgi:hypothetical protein
MTLIIIWISSSIPCQGIIITEYSVPGCLFHHHISHKHEVNFHAWKLFVNFFKTKGHAIVKILFPAASQKDRVWGRRESNRRLLCWKLNLNCFSRIDTKILSKSLSSILIALFGVLFCPSGHFWLIS